MKILVTGGAGFIGWAVVRYIIKNTTDTVINIDKLTYAGNLASLSEIDESPKYFFEQLLHTFIPFRGNSIENDFVSFILNISILQVLHFIHKSKSNNGFIVLYNVASINYNYCIYIVH